MRRHLAILAAAALLAAPSLHAQAVVDWHTTTEPVTVTGESGTDAGAFWGYHQTIVVRSGAHVYAAITDSYGPGQWDRRVEVHHRAPEGVWGRVFTTPDTVSTYSPAHLLVGPDGTVHLLLFMTKKLHYTSFSPGQDVAPVAWEVPYPFYRKSYPYPDQRKNPTGPPQGKLRLFRGGDTGSPDRMLTNTARRPIIATKRWTWIGFRCVRR